MDLFFFPVYYVPLAQIGWILLISPQVSDADFCDPHSSLEPIQQCFKISVAVLFSFQFQSFLF